MTSLLLLSRNLHAILFANGLRCLLLVALPVLANCSDNGFEIQASDQPERSFEDQVGTRFTAIQSYAFDGPEAEMLALHFPDDTQAIWSAIGRDDAGNLYLGASSSSTTSSRAHLLQYRPGSGELVAQGDTRSALQQAGLAASGATQNKLHSKFVQASDGYLYFSSFDEQGETAELNPVWGGHLWRKLPEDETWEHLLATEEALIAVNHSNDYVYALGYWNHVLYQYSLASGKVAKVVVGSVAGHISRSVLVDGVGHVYVPRVTAGGGGMSAVLVEFNADLEEVARHLLPSYRSDRPSNHHGIIGFTHQANGDVLFTSSDGGLYLIDARAAVADRVSYLGMMHPEGEAYIPALFPLDGRQLLVGVGRSANAEQEWLIYDLKARFGVSYPLVTSTDKLPTFYGTSTRDNAGNFYLVGSHKADGAKGYSPALFIVRLASIYR